MLLCSRYSCCRPLLAICDSLTSSLSLNQSARARFISVNSVREKEANPPEDTISTLKQHDRRSRVSRFWIPTGGIAVNVDDANEAISPLVRGAFLRQAYSGVFHLLPLGVRVQDKIEALLDKHMQSLGANKVSLATITSEALWKKSGRWTGNNPEMFQLASPKPTGYLLSPTHEEEITTVVANAVTSHKDLPLRLYQISRKYRNELRPRQGLLRTREFLMKDLYTFDTSHSAALETYAEVKKAYNAFFSELGIPYLVADADTGMMGGDLSHEFHYASPMGEDTVYSCKTCEFAVNDELAGARLVKKDGGGGEWGPCPKCGGELESHRAVELGHTFHLGTRYTEPLGAEVGIPVARTGSDTATSSDSTTTTTAHDTEYKRIPLSMGCHGIGVSRLMGAVASMLSTDESLTWPRVIAPFDVLIMSAVKDAGADMEAIYDQLSAESVGGLRIDPVLEDRDKNPGWKFRDAELVGYPVVVVLGRAWRSHGRVEVQCRRLKVKEEVHKDELVYYMCHLLARL